MRGAEPSGLALSIAVEEPEGSLESDKKRRREDKKKKRAKHDIQGTAQEPYTDESIRV